jgi:hypothetical protein
MAAKAEEPIHLVEDAETGDRFLVHDSARGPRLDIKFAGDTLWMTQAQIAELFGRDQSVISRHINNIVAEGELSEEGNMQKVHIARSDRPVTLHNLDMVISVGYRVSSVQATLFRRWATGILVRYARAGFVVDAARLKDPENADRVAELREIIRDIRADEANVYRELKRICAMCRDYDPQSGAAREFYRRTQAKLVYAVTSHTPSEVIAGRADHRADNMGADELAAGQCPQGRHHGFQELPGRWRNPRAEPADHHPARHLRGPARPRPDRGDGRCRRAVRSPACQSRPVRAQEWRHRLGRRSEAQGRSRI